MPAAELIYLNAVRWAADATQGSASGVVTSAGEPVSGVTVDVEGSRTSTTTGADGSYTLGLVDGAHTLRFSAEGYEPHEESVTIEDSSAVTVDVELTALPRSAVDGVVTDVSGRPVEGAAVSATGPSQWSVTTGADGRFVKDGLLDGEYTLRVEADGYLPAQAGLTVQAGSPNTVEIELAPVTVGVLGDVDSAVQQLLRDHDLAAGPLAWSPEPDLAGLDVVLVNGEGEATVDQAMFDALVAEADTEEVSVVYTGTWGVDRGGVRLLERFSDRVTVDRQGYGHGPVRLTGFDPDHPLTRALSDPATLVVEGGYYSTLADYAGAPLADLTVEREEQPPVSGLAAAYSWRSAGSLELVLSASAVTAVQGPGQGWTSDGERLLADAVAWAADAALEVPGVPTLEAAETLTADDEVAVSGSATWPSTVSVRRDGVEVAAATTTVDGGWTAEVPLVEGPNRLTAVAANAAGRSAPSDAVTVVRDTTGPQVDWTAPADRTGSFDSDLDVAGVVTDARAGVAQLRLGDTDLKVAEDGSFATTVPLATGENELTLTAVDVLGNETVVTRTVLHRPWSPRWGLPGRAPLVQLWLDGAPTDSPPAQQVTLVVSDVRGDEVARHEMRWVDDHFQARLDQPLRGGDTLLAELTVDGFAFEARAPDRRTS